MEESLRMQKAETDKKTQVYVEDSFSETCSAVTSGVITFFLMLITTVFPLIYHNSYIDILETKYKAYYIPMLAMLGILLILGLIMMLIDFKECGGEHTIQLFSGLKPKNWKNTFCIADAAVLIFWVIALISTLQSDYLYESFWGNEGRYSGLFLLTIYVVVYFVVSRFWKVQGWILQLFLISGMIMCYIGITDYFQLDILDFRGKIKPEQSTIFTSTVGNINTYTAYVAIIMGFAAALFTQEEKRFKMIWYYLCMTVSFFAIIMGCSENAYLAVGAMFAFLPFVVLKSRRGILRYLVMISTFVTVIQCIDWLNQAFADMVIGLDSLFRIISNFKGLFPMTILLWVITVCWYWFMVKKNVKIQKMQKAQNMQTAQAGSDEPVKGVQVQDLQDEFEAGKLLRRIWGGLLIAGAVALLFMLYDANAGGNGARYGSLAEYLVFDNSWGTNRGYIWKASFRMYENLKPIHKIFGFGPDTFGIMTTDKIMAEMIDATGQIFDNAHNAYIQYFVTIGPIGALAYIVFLISGIGRTVKMRVRNPYALGCALAVLCYACQAIVNLDLPIATPMMWMLMSAGIGIARKRRAGGYRAD